MRWSYCDNLVVYYFYRFLNCRTGRNHLEMLRQIAAIIGKSVGYVRMKIKNYNSLNGETPSLEHSSRVSVQIFNRFSAKDDATALRIMAE